VLEKVSDGQAEEGWLGAYENLLMSAVVARFRGEEGLTKVFINKNILGTQKCQHWNPDFSPGCGVSQHGMESIWLCADLTCKHTTVLPQVPSLRTQEVFRRFQALKA
jgi:hypothetical protein